MHYYIWYLKIQSGLVDPVLESHFQDMRDGEERWRHCTFYSSSAIMLDHFSNYVPGLISDYPLAEARDYLRTAMFMECNSLWHSDPKGRFTRLQIPDWNYHHICRRMYTRRTSSIFYKFSCGNAPLPRRGSNDCHCRYGCDDVETVDHVFYHCIYVAGERAHLRKE